MNQCLAYLITFTGYGTWLHGDEATSVDRDHNIPGGDRLDKNARHEQYRAGQLTSAPVLFNSAARAVVERSIGEVCQYKEWYLHALAVRTNHVHVVVSAPLPPEKVMQALKAYSTRALRAASLFRATDKVWTHHGSTRYLWKPESLRAAITYVMEGQGSPLPPQSEPGE